MIITYAMQIVTLLLFYIFAATLPTLYLASALLGWSFAVTLALFPTLTSICFGTNHLGVDYGLIFTAVGVGALLSAIGLWIVNVTESYALVFVFAGILAGMGLILCIVLKKKYAIS